MNPAAESCVAMEEDCFLTMARSIVDEVLGRYGVELDAQADEQAPWFASETAKAA